MSLLIGERSAHAGLSCIQWVVRRSKDGLKIRVRPRLHKRSITIGLVKSFVLNHAAGNRRFLTLS